MVVQRVKIRPYLTFNVLRVITTTITDLLLGEEPGLGADELLGEQIVANLAKRSELHRVFYTAGQEASWSGEATAEVVRWDGQVWVQNLAPGQVYPIGVRNPDGQYSSYVSSFRSQRAE